MNVLRYLIHSYIPMQLRARPFIIRVTISTSIRVHGALRAGVPIQILDQVDIVFLCLLRFLLFLFIVLVLFCLLFLDILLLFRFRLIFITLTLTFNITLRLSGFTLTNPLHPLRTTNTTLLLIHFLLTLLFCSTTTRLGLLPLPRLNLRINIHLLLQSLLKPPKLQLLNRTEYIRRRDGPFQGCFVCTVASPLVHIQTYFIFPQFRVSKSFLVTWERGKGGGRTEKINTRQTLSRPFAWLGGRLFGLWCLGAGRILRGARLGCGGGGSPFIIIIIIC